MKFLVKNHMRLSELNNTSQQDMSAGDTHLSRRTFCRSALIGGSLLGLTWWKSGLVFAQEDEPDSQELMDLVSMGVLDYDEATVPDEPDLEDPSIDDFQIYLPLVQGGSDIQATNSISTTITASATTTEQARPISNRERAVRAARAEIGEHEVPLGSNRTEKYEPHFHVNGRQWCVYFVSWAFDTTGNNDRRVPWPAGSVQGLLDWARMKERQGRHVLFTEPRRGDIFIMKGGGESHAGIVRWRYEDGSILTVEGNTTRTSKPTNDPREIAWVASKRRDIDSLRKRGVPCYFVRVPKNPW